MAETDKGPWDLGLEVIDILAQPGCGWNYEVGFKTVWDGRHFPEGMCPFAWNAFSPWIWALRYRGSNEPLGYQSEDEMTFVCPDTRHMIVWRIQRIKDKNKSVAGPLNNQRRETARKLKIEVDELPKGRGCERGYEVGDSWVCDGGIPQDFCPLAWNVLNLWIWPLRYGGSPRPMGWPGKEVKYNCPIHEHPVVFCIRPIGGAEQVKCGA